MNIQEYLKNPIGKGSSVFMLSDLQAALDEQYKDIVNKIRITWYTIAKKYLVAHVQIPSRSVDKLFYDVLIEINIDSIPGSSTIINGGSARVFSNCPSFTFTYAKVFLDRGDLIPWTKKKYNTAVFASDPDKRNPLKITGYERSLYFAIKYITTNGRNYKNKIKLNTHAVKDVNDVLKAIKSSDDILDLYQRGKKSQKDKDSNTKTQKPGVPSPENQGKKPLSSKFPNKKGRVKSIGNVKKTPHTKSSRSSHTKHVKKIK